MGQKTLKGCTANSAPPKNFYKRRGKKKQVARRPAEIHGGDYLQGGLPSNLYNSRHPRKVTKG